MKTDGKVRACQKNTDLLDASDPAYKIICDDNCLQDPDYSNKKYPEHGIIMSIGG